MLLIMECLWVFFDLFKFFIFLLFWWDIFFNDNLKSFSSFSFSIINVIQCLFVTSISVILDFSFNIIKSIIQSFNTDILNFLISQLFNLFTKNSNNSCLFDIFDVIYNNLFDTKLFFLLFSKFNSFRLFGQFFNFQSFSFFLFLNFSSVSFIKKLLFWFFKFLSVFFDLILSYFPVIIFTGSDEIL